jgi:DNA-directed RNA polymerase specialized sigma24 family protein
VEDLAQDVFLKLFARIEQVRPDENFSLAGSRDRKYVL